MMPGARWILALAAFALAPSCRRRQAFDPRAVVPLVAHAEDAGDNENDPRRVVRARGDASVPSSRRGVRYIADRPQPDGALGVRWGATRADVTARNRTATIECRDSREFLFCRRALVEVPIPVVVTYEFCGDALCAVSIDGQATRDEAQLASHYERLLAMVRTTLGAPSDEARRVGAGCQGHMALCLASKQSELSAHWSWRDGPQVQLSVDQDEEDALRALAAVTWFSAERARRQDPIEPPPRPAAADGSAAAGDDASTVDDR